MKPYHSNFADSTHNGRINAGCLVNFLISLCLSMNNFFGGIGSHRVSPASPSFKAVPWDLRTKAALFLHRFEKNAKDRKHKHKLKKDGENDALCQSG